MTLPPKASPPRDKTDRTDKPPRRRKPLAANLANPANLGSGGSATLPPELLAALRAALRQRAWNWLESLLEKSEPGAPMLNLEAAGRLRLLEDWLRRLEQREEDGWTWEICPDGHGQIFTFDDACAIRAYDLRPLREEIRRISLALLRRRRVGTPGKARGHQIARSLAGYAVGFGLHLFRNIDGTDPELTPSACDLAAEALKAVKECGEARLREQLDGRPMEWAPLTSRLVKALLDELPVSYDAVRRTVEEPGRATNAYRLAVGNGSEAHACWRKMQDSRL